MSYCVCLNCKEMVGGYEKYCPACSARLGLAADSEWWKEPHSELKFGDASWEALRVRELQKDSKRASESFTTAGPIPTEPELSHNANRHERRAFKARKR